MDTNANFACFLQHQMEAGKLNKTTFTKNFIDEHTVNGASPRVGDPTPEMKEYAKVFFQKKAKSSDSQFVEVMTGWTAEKKEVIDLRKTPPIPNKGFKGEY